MYAREGPWHLVDRIWALDVRTGQKTLVQPRSQQLEIAGHEFFQHDGSAIWYDHQAPKSQNFFLACFNTAQRRSGAQYPLSRETWSLHFTISPSGRFFVGDGGFAGHAARTNDARYINAYIPKGDKLEVVRLLNMSQHDYMKVEPNVHVSPDERSVVFSGHFDGQTQLYKIDISDIKDQLQGTRTAQTAACLAGGARAPSRAAIP
jgi:oligogalacturonide lyase